VGTSHPAARSIGQPFLQVPRSRRRQFRCIRYGLVVFFETAITTPARSWSTGRTPSSENSGAQHDS
jgi:hypothetical protein